MKVLSFGSYNIDETYHVDHFVRPGETLKNNGYSRALGGKGFNQTMALYKAGAHVLPAGAIGEDGDDFLKAMEDFEDLSYIHKVDALTGHAFIQLVQGENAIIIDEGANACITPDLIHEAIAASAPGDYLLIQNEINNLTALIHEAHLRKMKIFFNAAPMNEEVFKLPLEEVDVLIVNEIEAAMLVGAHDDLITALQKKFPHKEILLTLGEQGSVYIFEDLVIKQKAITTQVVDTTGAGDTYIGYFLASLLKGETIKEAMEKASYASALAISHLGASQSIPTLQDVETMMVRQKVKSLPLFTTGDVTYKKGRFNQDLPVFDEGTKAYVYAFYSAGLLKRYKKENASLAKKKIGALNLLETVDLIVYYIRQGTLDKKLFASCITSGILAALDRHLRELIKER